MQILLGRLGGDPEMKETKNGNQVCTFSLATSKKQNGNQKTTWHRCIAWNKKAEILNQYLRKGSEVFIKGELEVQSWKDDKGNDRQTYQTVVDDFQFVSGKKKSQDDPDSWDSDFQSGSGWMSE